MFVCVLFACYVYLCIKKGALSESRARQMRRNNNSKTDIKFNAIAIYDCTSSTATKSIDYLYCMFNASSIDDDANGRLKV